MDVVEVQNASIFIGCIVQVLLILNLGVRIFAHFLRVG